MTEFLELFLGEMPKHEWVYSFLLMGMGAFMYVFLRVKNRTQKEVKVSIVKWVTDKNFQNIKAGIFAVILSYLLIRFYSNYQEIIKEWLPEGMKLTPHFLMVVVGFGQHWIAEWLAKFANK